ncbi:MAG: hypothetical protein WBP93_16215 [Pyrinomonadaceae bacterium]
MKKARPAALLCRSQLVGLLAFALLLVSSAAATHAQSSDIELPTPVRAPEIRAVITPRDIGDPRVTRHFYAFSGTQGDLIISVESKNLDGDVDVFTAGDLRPLAKVSMYAGESLTRASKSIFLRRHENLILRIEARSPNDEDGSYTIRFGGSFEASSAETAAPETPAENSPATGRRDKNARRVSSVGARIEEPPAEREAASKVEEQPVPAPTPITVTEAPTSTAEPARSTATRRSTARSPRIGRPPVRARRPAPKPTPPAAREAEAKADEGGGGEKNTGEATNAAASTRLIIETRDGTRVERFMSNVRRVTVENGMVVVITKDGKVDRQPLANILRMAIEQ